MNQTRCHHWHLVEADASYLGPGRLARPESCRCHALRMKSELQFDCQQDVPFFISESGVVNTGTSSVGAGDACSAAKARGPFGNSLVTMLQPRCTCGENNNQEKICSWQAQAPS